MFSIIVPIYNVEKYIDKCINSLIAQDCDDYEILLIDDCSSDASLRKAYKWAEQNRNIKVIKKDENRGLSDTRNIGINNAKYEYIMFVDSDDYIEINVLSKIEKLIKENGYPDVLYMGFVEERGEKSVVRNGFVSIPNKKYTKREYLVSELKQRNLYAPACFGVYKKSVILDNDIYFKTGILHEDELWTPQMVFNSEYIYLSDIVFYHYVKRDNSITTKKDKTKNGIDLLNISIELMNLYGNIGDAQLRKLMENHIAMLYMKAIARGKMYRREYSHLFNRCFPIRHISTTYDACKALLFLTSPYVYCLFDQKFGKNE